MADRPARRRPRCGLLLLLSLQLQSISTRAVIPRIKRMRPKPVQIFKAPPPQFSPFLWRNEARSLLLLRGGANSSLAQSKRNTSSTKATNSTEIPRLAKRVVRSRSDTSSRSKTSGKKKVAAGKGSGVKKRVKASTGSKRASTKISGGSLIGNLAKSVSEFQSDFKKRYREAKDEFETEVEKWDALQLEGVDGEEEVQEEEAEEASAPARQGTAAPGAGSAAAYAPQEEVQELTPAERGALLGSVLLSPSGIGGVVIGGAVGGAVGLLVGSVEQVRSHVASAYGERVQLDKRNAAQMNAAARTLHEFNEVRVRGADTEESTRLTAELLVFLESAANLRCADCAIPFQQPNEVWSSITFGVLVCKRCAAAHRALGASHSRIKSLVYDRWSPLMASELMDVGNARARELYLARLPRGYAEPTEETDTEKLHAFVHSKYVRLRWAEAGLKEERAKRVASERAREGKSKGRPRRRTTGTTMASLSSEDL